MTDTVRVRFFASLREAVGRGELAFTADDAPADLNALIERLERELGAAAMPHVRAPSVRVAVNRTLVEGNAPLRAGDEVAFLPPVTGG